MVSADHSDTVIVRIYGSHTFQHTSSARQVPLPSYADFFFVIRFLSVPTCTYGLVSMLAMSICLLGRVLAAVRFINAQCYDNVRGFAIWVRNSRGYLRLAT